MPPPQFVVVENEEEHKQTIHTDRSQTTTNNEEGNAAQSGNDRLNAQIDDIVNELLNSFMDVFSNSQFS